MRTAKDTSDVRRDLVGLLPRLRRFALTLTRNVAEADTLVKDTCERAIFGIESWNGRGRLESWLYGMMRATWTDGDRKRPTAPVTPPSAGGPAKTTIDPASLQARILSLPESLASVFLLVAVEKYGYREASEILAISQSIVASHLCAARTLLSDISTDTTDGRA